MLLNNTIVLLVSWADVKTHSVSDFRNRNKLTKTLKFVLPDLLLVKSTIQVINYMVPRYVNLRIRCNLQNDQADKSRRLPGVIKKLESDQIR